MSGWILLVLLPALYLVFVGWSTPVLQCIFNRYVLTKVFVKSNLTGGRKTRRLEVEWHMAEKELRVTWWRVVLSAPGSKKSVCGGKKRRRTKKSEYLKRSLRPDPAPRTAHTRARTKRRRGCGLLWSCAAASLRCTVSRARFVFGGPAGTDRHRWVGRRLFF